MISKLNEEVLKELAEVTNGIYARLQSSDEAVKVLKGQLSQIDRKAFGDMSLMNFTTYYYVLRDLCSCSCWLSRLYRKKRGYAK